MPPCRTASPGRCKRGKPDCLGNGYRRNQKRTVRSGRFLKPADIDEETLKKIRALNELAQERGEKLAQMALSWVLRDGEVTSVLIGASRASQILENVKMLDSPAFTEEELRKIDEICGIQR